MSIALMTAAWALDLPTGEKIVLLSLADNASDAGHCWPSMATISKRAGMTTRGAQKIVQRLCEMGHLTRKEITGKGCNYWVHPRTTFTSERGSPPNQKTQTPERRSDKSSRTVIPPVVDAKARFHRLPADWQPDALPETLSAKRAGWPPGWEAERCDDFRAWAANAADSNGKGRKLDWNQAWQNWLRREDRERKPSTSNGPLRGTGSPGQHGGNHAISPRLAASLDFRQQFLPAD